MKKWLYLVTPTVMTVVFLFFYLGHVKEAREKDLIRQQEVAKLQQEEATRKAMIEEKARQDAERRAAERAAEDLAKELDKQAKWDAQGKEIADATTDYNAKAAAFQKEINRLEIELDTIRKTKEAFNAEVLELAKKVELAEIAKRSAELENARLVEVISNRLAASALTKP